MAKAKKSFFRYCERCGNPFHPTGQWCKYCDNCKKPNGYPSHKKTCPYYQHSGRCTNVKNDKNCIFNGKPKDCIFLKDSPTKLNNDLE